MTNDQARARHRRILTCAQAVALVVSVAAIGFVVCCNRRASVTPTPPPSQPPTIEIALHCYVVSPRWTDALRRRKDENMRVALKPAGIFVGQVMYEPIDRPDWRHVTPTIAYDMNNRVTSDPPTPQLAIFLVESIEWDGQPVGGLGFAGGCAIVALQSCETVQAHELGHVFTLPHRDDGLNLMRGDTCGGYELAADQIAAMRVAAAAATSRDRTAARERVGPPAPPFVCGGGR